MDGQIDRWTDRRKHSILFPRLCAYQGCGSGPWTEFRALEGPLSLRKGKSVDWLPGSIEVEKRALGGCDWGRLRTVSR